MNREKIEEILKNIGNEDVPADVHKIAEDVCQDFNKTLAQPSQPGRLILGDYIMKSRLTKLAIAAAVIILVVLVGLPFIGKKGPGIVLADVLAKVEQSRAYIYKMKMTMTGVPNMPAGKQETEGTITISNEYGMKIDMDIVDPNTGKKTAQQMYMLPAKKIAYMIMPEAKKYIRMEFNEDLLARAKKQNNDPREMIKQILNSHYTELGRSIIDGIEVEGFQTTDPAMVGGLTGTAGVNYTLWVDTKSWLPVRADMEIKINEQMEMQGVIYDFQWDIPANASDFEPVIPEDFTGLAGLKMPEMNEQAAIEGLRFLIELFGKYPKKIDYINLMQEFGNLMQEFVKLNDNQSPAAEQKRELMRRKFKKPQSEEEKETQVIDMMRPIQSLGLFYMTLIQDKKEPVYYGESVGPADGDKVLLRWKVSDGQYRVIYGNLTTADITAEQLTELEVLQSK
jgi:outer membrane lipoprotein-sorting protein